MKSLGQKIKGLREDRDMTQDELGKCIGVSRQSICSFESDVNEPKIQYLIELSKIFEVSIDYLVDNINGPDEDIYYLVNVLSENAKLRKIIVDLVRGLQGMGKE